MNMRLLPQFVLALIYTALYSMLLYMVFSGKAQISDELQDIGKMLIGFLTAILLRVIGFFYDSSAGSKDKDIMKRLEDK